MCQLNCTIRAGNLLIYLLKAYSPVNHTGSPQGFSQVQIKHKLNTTQNMDTIYIYKRKIYKPNPKVSPFGIALVKKKRQIKLGETGTIDHFGMAF